MRDLAHRVLWTFVEATIGMLVASSLLDVDLPYLAISAASGVAAALVVVKEYARRQLDR
jgi:hypothetical protein